MRAGVQSYEVALVTVLGVPVAPVVVPLVQIAALADGIGVQAGERPLVGCHGVAAHTPCYTDVLQQLTDDGQIGSTAIAGDAVIAIVRNVFIFRRCRGRSNQLT